MHKRRTITLDANEAAASVTFRINEIIVIYPITPWSPMGGSRANYIKILQSW